MKYFALILFLLLSTVSAIAQLSFQSGEQYLKGMVIKKVIITHDDLTAWAITALGQVYFKPANETDFALYTPTIGEVVDDLSGFGASEMYFSIKPKKLIRIKNNVKEEITLSDPEIKEIRNIAVGLEGSKYIGPNYNDDIYRKDWLAIATDKYLYTIVRGETVSSRLDIFRQPNFDIRDYTIVRNGIKSVEFKAAFSSSGRCQDWESKYSVIRHINGTTYGSVIPDKGKYSDINCTLFDFQSPYSSDYALDLWGTDQALYLKFFGKCGEGDLVRTLINGKVNSLDVLFCMSSYKRETFAVAATDNGFYYTPDKIYLPDDPIADLDRIKFIPYDPLKGIKINNFSTEYVDFKPSTEETGFQPPLYCEKVVWLATDEGVKKLYVMYDGEEFEEKLHTDVYYDKAPSAIVEGKLSFDLCASSTLEINTRIAPYLSGPLLIQWYKNGVEIPEWVGKVAVSLKEAGDYEATFTALCEGIKRRSEIYSLQFGKLPEAPLQFPATMNICAGQTQILNTINNSDYTYRWFKDNILIDNASTFNYTVNEAGKYRVETSNCIGTFVSSPEVEVNVLTLPKPIISGNKADFCIGDTPELKVNNVNGNRVKWFLEGMEQTIFQDQETIKVTTEGSYRAVLINANDCEVSSDIYKLILYAKPIISITKTPDRLLCFGERTTLSVPQVAGYTYVWSDGNTGSSTVATSSGAYSVTVTNSNGCSNTSLPVTVTVSPLIVLSSPSESKLCTYTGETVTLNADPGYQYYTWNGIRTSDNTFKVTAPGNYQLQIQDVLGCTANTTFKVIPWCISMEIVNAFSPNGDGKNDVWRVVGLESDPTAIVLIYNRFGTLLYQTKGTNAQWDGRVKGLDAPGGIYYYVITSRQTTKPLKGSVTLVR